MCSQDDLMSHEPKAQTPNTATPACEPAVEAPNNAAPAPDVAVDPEMQQRRNDLFSHYAEPSGSANDGAGGAPNMLNAMSADGAGGAPNSGNGTEGASAGGSTGAPEKSVWQRVKDWWSGDSKPAESPASDAAPAQPDAPKAETAPAETPGDKPAEPAKQSPSEMTPEEREADKNAKMDEYAKQSPEEKAARWAKNDGKLGEEEWKKIQNMDPAAQKQAMLQAGIDKLDYDDPRRAQLENIQHRMGGKDAVTPSSKPPDGETKNLLTKAGRTGDPQTETNLPDSSTRCGEVAGQMLNFGKGDKAPGLPGGSYYYTKGCEADDKNATPGSGDVFHLRDEAKNGKAADDNGHASTFVVSSPDGTKWLTYDGGQGSANGDGQKIALSMRDVSVDENGRTMVSGANGPRAVSKRWDYEKMYKKYLSSPDSTQ
jgi:hypothetical protein